MYLLASDILDYSLNVRQIDRRLRNIIYLTKRVLLYYFYIISRVHRTVITNLCELRAISTKVVVLGTPIRHAIDNDTYSAFFLYFPLIKYGEKKSEVFSRGVFLWTKSRLMSEFKIVIPMTSTMRDRFLDRQRTMGIYEASVTAK